MENTIRIKTKVGVDGGNSYYLKFKLDQTYDFLEILSLRVSQDDVYRKFSADYGVVIGRVTVNGGFGVPNANVSIFIPISEVDKANTMLYSLYPYETTSDEDEYGVRYNLLPKKHQNECHFPIGTYPNKREFLDNDILLEIHDKYYKYTTTTNNAGDYMLFGIPTGPNKIHIDVDISDIGVATQRPYDLAANGTTTTSFDSPTKFKDSTNLDDLRHIIRGEVSVNVAPFWSDNEDIEVGVNRVDYGLPERIQTAAIFIGSVITDNEKQSVNKNCRPRKKMGNIKEIETSTGQIEMIRKTIGGNIEYKNLGNGQLIDDDGTWAYQVKMNLNPMVTSEYGELIPSEDPSKGLFTKSDVRFRITMDGTGEEGRLRERAAYLVPHNPDTVAGNDFTFDETTRDESFFTMQWNNIYTVRNFIPRYQASGNRNFIGIKEVDESESKLPYPYTRIDTQDNPLFQIILSLLVIILIIVIMLNALILPIFNMVIFMINVIICFIMLIWDAIKKAICGFISGVNGLINTLNSGLEWAGVHINNITPPSMCSTTTNIGSKAIHYIPPVILTCSNDNSTVTLCDGQTYEVGYAPGCEPTALTNIETDGDCPAGDIHNTHPYYNSPNYPPETLETDPFEYLVCQATALIEWLDMYSLDFYNDWVNGNLYFFLFKRKYKRGYSKFCEYDCGSNNPLSYSHQSCNTRLVLDTSVSPIDLMINFSVIGIEPFIIGESQRSFCAVNTSNGVVKQLGSYLYYPPIIKTHEGVMKFFATDITVLGSRNKCDTEGFPYIIDRLPATSYKKGPPIDIKVTTCDSNGGIETVVEESGIMGNAVTNPGLFMGVYPMGISVNYCQVRNIKLQSEIGRVTDEETDVMDVNNRIGALDFSGNDCTGTYSGPSPLALYDPSGNGPESQDIGDEFVRFSLRGMNTPVAISGGTFDLTVAQGMYDSNYVALNGYKSHIDFRAYNGCGGTDGEYPYDAVNHTGMPTNNSYYFYFGLHPGKSAIDKMNSKFFTNCVFHDKKEFIISGTTTDVTTFGGSDGSLNIEIIGGQPPYDYEVTGPNSFTEHGNITTTTFGFINLEPGNYVVTVVDIYGNSNQATFTIYGVLEIEGGLFVSGNTTFGASDGQISVEYIINGVPPYTAKLYKVTPTAGFLTEINNITTFPVNFPNLSPGWYEVEISDSDGQTKMLPQIEVTEPISLMLAINHHDVICHDGENGEINLTLSGAAPMSISMVHPDGTETHTATNGGLIQGNYLVDVTDGLDNSPSDFYINGVLQSPPYTFPYEISITNPTLFKVDTGSTSYVDMYRLTCNNTPHPANAIKLPLIGGNGGYKFKDGTHPTWTAVPSGDVYVNAGGGTGTLTDTVYFIDASGCTFTKTIEIIPPPLKTHVITETKTPTCHGNTEGFITIKVGGGRASVTGFNSCTQKYYLELHKSGVSVATYTIDGGGTGYAGPYEYTFTGLGGGDYTIHMYDIDSNCTSHICPQSTNTISLPEPLALSLYIGGETNDSGSGTVTVYLTPQGGTPSYKFSKDNITWQTSPSFTNLGYDTEYTFRVKDTGAIALYPTGCADCSGCKANITFTTMVDPS